MSWFLSTSDLFGGATFGLLHALTLFSGSLRPQQDSIDKPTFYLSGPEGSLSSQVGAGQWWGLEL